MEKKTSAIDPMSIRRCRHCARFPFEDRDRTYASVLVAGGALLDTIELLEKRIIPCVTAVCPECDKISLISDGSTESMISSIYMWQRLREWIDTDYGVIEDAVAVNGVKHEDGTANHTASGGEHG